MIDNSIEISDIATLIGGGLISIYISKNIQAAINKSQFKDTVFSDEVKSVLNKFSEVERLLLVNSFQQDEFPKLLKIANMATADLLFICEVLNMETEDFTSEFKTKFQGLRRSCTRNVQISPGGTSVHYFLAPSDLSQAQNDLDAIKKLLISLRFGVVYNQ